MEKDKVEQTIMNPVEENRKKLEQLFPGVIKDGELDLTALREELGDTTEVEKEKYELMWAGKSKAKQIANTDIGGRTLHYIPEDSKDPDTTENLYIEGDNLEVLKLLRSSYYGQIKMIYIDPPYNTGNDFVYKDNFNISKEQSDKDEGETDEEGTRYIVNQKSSNRYHANWLNMMYPRLKVAKDLLRDDGVIFISIDDNEVANLRKLCDEVFGEENLVSLAGWQKVYSSKNQAQLLSNDFEFVLIYSKNISFFQIGLLPRTEEMNKRYQNPDNDFRGDWKSGDLVAAEERKGGHYIIKNPYTGQEYDVPSGKHWAFSEPVMLDMLKDSRVYFGKNNDSFPSFKQFLSEVKQGRVASSLFLYKDFGHTDEAKKDFIKLFGEDGKSIFETLKPIRLIQNLTRICNIKSNDIVLDFFSGSSTTAHAIIGLNAEDGCNRKFIMVQLPEICDEKSEAYKAGYNNICEIGKKRIKLAGEKIKKELIEKQRGSLQIEENSVDPEKLDIGFKVFRIGDTNIRWNKENFDQQRSLEESAYSDKDHLDFMAGFKDIDVVYEIMLRHRDIPLSSKVELLNDIGTRTYIFADTVVVCLEEKITNQIVDKIAAIDPKPQKIIFRDSAFDDDISLKLNTLTRFDIQLKKNNQTKDQTYRVEFI